MYTFDDLKADVTKEVTALKTHATKNELHKLSAALLDPSDVFNCYYGLMTDCCHSERAVELIKICAIRYVVDCTLTSTTAEGFQRISEHVCTKGMDDFESGRGFSGYYSALEAYALLKDAKNENIIAYLKGETDILEL